MFAYYENLDEDRKKLYPWLSSREEKKRRKRRRRVGGGGRRRLPWWPASIQDGGRSRMRAEKENERSKGRGCAPSGFIKNAGGGRVLLGEIRVVFDYLQPKLAIVYYFNLNPLKPASNILNLQNILGFTIPSYFKFLNCLVNYLHTHYSKFPKYPKNPQKFVKIPKFQISTFIISQNTL